MMIMLMMWKALVLLLVVLRVLILMVMQLVMPVAHPSALDERFREFR